MLNYFKQNNTYILSLYIKSYQILILKLNFLKNIGPKWNSTWASKSIWDIKTAVCSYANSYGNDRESEVSDYRHNYIHGWLQYLAYMFK